MAEKASRETPAAERRPALTQATHVRRGVLLRTAPPQTRFSLRLPMGGADATPEAAGFQLGLPINRYWANGELWSARLGPNEWMIGGRPERTEDIAAQVEAALAGRIHALTDISHRQVAIEAAGPETAALLNAGCPLDLADEVFPAGSATRTVLGKAEIVLIRPGEESVFRIECWRSFARYVQDFLVEASLDFEPVA